MMGLYRHKKVRPVLITLAIILSSACSDSPQVDSVKAAACKTTANGKCVNGRLLHVPSPDWRDQIIYLTFIDRFNDGDPSLNDQGAGVFDPSRVSHYSGGDLQGIIDKIDYIRDLGATALWTTPPVAAQWWNTVQEYAGYHGYWPRNISEIDEHFGSLSTYKDLSHELHTRGMYLIQDIVINHVGNYFDYETEYDPSDPTIGFKFVGNTIPSSAPTLYPFNLNNANDPEHLEAGIYHWTPLITNLHDPVEEWSYQLGRLDDINTGNPLVRKTFKDTYSYWIREVGVDAFRIDTVKYVEHDFWHDFIHAQDGIARAAVDTGRHNFLSFGEVKEVSEPLSDFAEKKLAGYLGSPDKPELDSVIGFPLQEELGQVFSSGRPTRFLSYRLKQHLNIYPDPYIILNFINNHDVPRFLAGGSTAGMKQALALIFTIPGIPVIYQGDEQNLIDARQAMFAGGFLSGGDQFNQQSEMYSFIRALAKLRQSSKIFSRGSMELLADNPTSAGVFAYKRSHLGETVFIIMNTAEHTSLLNKMPTGLPEGSRLTALFGHPAEDDDLAVGGNGKLTMAVPPRAIFVLKAGNRQRDTAASATINQILVDQNIDGKTLAGETQLSGTAGRPAAKLKLVVNGNLDSAHNILADGDGRWQARLSAADYGRHHRFFEIYAEELNIASDRQAYVTELNHPTLDLRYTDALDDDRGPSGRYSIPGESTFGRQMDIESARIRSAGNVLQLDITMHELTDMWIATNDFDHLSLSIFIDLADTQGLKDLPQLHAQAPENFLWDFAHTLYGWGNSVVSSESQSKNSPQKTGIAPRVTVNRPERTISIIYDLSQLKSTGSWDGAKMYLTTWDREGEGGLRPLTQQGGFWEFGGGAADEPLILDDLLVELPEK